MNRPLRKPDVLRKLRENEPALRRDYFVKTLALFGSVARDDSGPDSDLDLLVEFDRPVSLFDLVGAAQFIEKLFDLPEDRVDLVLRRNVIPELRDIIFGEAIDVFDSEKMEIPHSASA